MSARRILPAAGLASLLKAILGVSHGVHPPFVSATEPLTHFDYARAGFAFAREPRAWRPASGVRVARITSFPDGGTNCSVIVESYPEPQPAARPPLPVETHDTFWVLTE